MSLDIKHVWFDMDGTLTVHTDEFNKIHDDLRYTTYAKVTGREVDEALIKDYGELYKIHGSNSAVFTSLGKPSDFWMQYFDQIDQTRYYEPIPDVYQTLDSLRKRIPISLFTNARIDNVHKTLSVINVSADWFTHVLTGDDVPNRKPAVDGFHLMLERSELDASQIMYVGDRVDVDIRPAKSLGMFTCLVYGTSDEADLSISNMKQLLDVV